MSVVIIGGNECMEREYKTLCKKHGCRAKVFCRYNNCMKDRIGNPDMMILFTHTVSHKMVQCAISDLSAGTTVIRSHTSSLASLRKILQENAG